MATLNTNSFTSYTMSEEEILQSSILTTQQTQLIQNQIAQLAEELLTLEFSSDPALQLQFVQQQAYTKGQLDALKYLLDISEAAEQQRVDEALLDSIHNKED